VISRQGKLRRQKIVKIKTELAKAVGAENVSDDPEVLRAYSWDCSINAPRMPNYVARPGNTEEVQKVVRIANESGIPLVPCSSGIHFYGNTIPNLGGIMLDMKRMNRILDVDLYNKMVRVEPGVTWGQLQAEAAKHKMMGLCPLLPHPQKSVLTSHLEREPMLIPKFEYAGPMVTVEVVFADGEVFRTGSACVPGFPDKSMAEGVNPGGPGYLSYQWLVQGAQGTMGVVTWAKVKLAPRPKIDKTFFIPFDNLEDAVQLVYNVQRRMIGEECLILNNVNLASILARKWPQDYDNLVRILSPWTVILVSGGGWRRPEERIEYEEEGLREAADELHIPVLPTSLPGLPVIGRELPGILRNAWSEKKTYWKFANKGASQDIFFYTTLDRTPEFTHALGQVAADNSYCIDDIGIYIQPMEYGRACHFECNFSYDPDNPGDVATVDNLYGEAAETAIDMGGYFSRPYGVVADMVYDGAASYTSAMKKVKQLLDPKNIMSPGRLCF
jgi:FAD/FMN-containing dehydrogenase